MRVIFESPDEMYRIVEHPDFDSSLDDLKGDMYNPEACPDVPNIRAEELAFEALVEREGVYGYELQKWNGAPAMGYEAIDSCWGFVGMYSETTNNDSQHYIIDEMKRTIERLSNDTRTIAKTN